MPIDESSQENIPNDTEAYYEELAGQEEVYLEVTEEELRAILTSSDPSQHKTTVECWEMQREELERGWRKIAS